MKTLESLEALMLRILDLDKRKVDLVADTRSMSLASNGSVRLDVDTETALEAFELNPHARGQLATDLGIPKKYFDRMVTDAPDLLNANVNHWLASEPERRMVRGFRDPSDPALIEGRAWLSDRYRRLDHIEIAQRLLPEFENVGTEVQFHQAAITDDRLYIRAVFPRMQTDIKVGDAVQWGVDIRNSEVGSGTFSISGFVLRLLCTNGMTTTDAIKTRHVGRRIEEEGILSNEALLADDTAFWLAARDYLRATVSEVRFEEVVSQLRGTLEGERIAAPITATEVMQQRFSLSDPEREQVLMHLVAGGDLSRWGALNAVTATAKNSESFDRQAELEDLGWAMANLPAKEWEHIAIPS